MLINCLNLQYSAISASFCLPTSTHCWHGQTNLTWQEFDSIRSADSIHLRNQLESIIPSSN